jgi:CheY-like chemotaxis protein
MKANMDSTKILVVDDDEVLRMSLSGVLKHCGFSVTSAANVPDALKLITGPETYDVLLSDLHMPGAGDGLTVVSAMRHANPLAVTLLLSASPQMIAASQAILQQTDEILVKPVDAASLIQTIRQRLENGPSRTREIETVAAILERTTDCTIQDWFERIQTDRALMSVSMGREVRCGHLPLFFREIISCLLSSKPAGRNRAVSAGAVQHGCDRLAQGYTASMLVEESRMLQASIFQTLQNNLEKIDYSQLLIGVMTIADEIDSQLAQAVASYSAESFHTTARQPENNSPLRTRSSAHN